VIVLLHSDEIVKLEEHFEGQLKMLQDLLSHMKTKRCKEQVQKEIDFFENMLVALAEAVKDI